MAAAAPGGQALGDAPSDDSPGAFVAIIPPSGDLKPDPDAVMARGAFNDLPDNVRDFPSLVDWLTCIYTIPAGSTFHILGKPRRRLPPLWLDFGRCQFPDGDLYIKIVLPSGDSLPLSNVLQKLDALGVEVSATRSASGISADDFELVRQALKIRGPISEDKDGKPLDDDGNVLEQLLGDDRFWDQRYEEQQRAEYSKIVQGWMASKRCHRSIRWVNGNRETIRRRFEGLHFTVSSKNDLVAVLRRFGELYGQGAVLGVELKRKTLTRRSLRQALMEFFLWADTSCVPFVQLITDMQKGGVAYYCKGIDAGTGIELRQVVLKNMLEVQEFVSSIGAALPDDLGGDGPDGLILHHTLGAPPRKKFRQMERDSWQGRSSMQHDSGEGPSMQQMGEERATKGQIALWTIGARFLENDGDVANLADLDSFQKVLGDLLIEKVSGLDSNNQ